MKVFTILVRIFQYTWTTFVFTTKQLIAQRGLSLALLLGLVTSSAMTMSIPIYADAVNQQVLEAQIASENEPPNDYQRPPFAFMFRYIGSWSGPVGYAETLAVSDYFTGAAISDLGLPLELNNRYFKTATLRLFSREETHYDALNQNLAFIAIGTLTNLEDHINLLEGQLPSNQIANGTLDVLVNETFANQLGLQSGEQYQVFERVRTGQGVVRVEIPIRISGIWRPLDTNDPYWFYNVTEFDTVLLAHPEAFVQHVLPAFRNELDLALWYLVMDGSQVKSSDVNRVVSHIFHTRQRAFNLLPGLRLDISPLERLSEYQRKSRNLTLFLYSYSVPLIGMILAFISLVSAMAVQQRRTQIVTMRSRGATYGQMIGMAAFEGSILGVISMGMGLPCAFLIAYAIGRTRSFLDFTAVVDLSYRLPETVWQVGLGVMAFALIAQIIPVLGASRYTIVTYKQERARQSKPPWWQSAWLDVLFLIPVGYGIYLLQKTGGNLAGLPNDPFQNPLFMLLPALSIFGMTLFLLRLLPWVMKGIAWLAAKRRGVSLLLATCQLARMGNDYHAPLILLVFTLSMSTFTASMAQTLDRYLFDKNYYEIGTDLSLDETGELNTEIFGSFFGVGAGEQEQEAAEKEGPRWFFLPVSEHLRVAGIQSAARVRIDQANIELPDRSIQGLFLGLDRVDFTKVSFWRQDFAPESLGALMNQLALSNNGALVPRNVIDENAFQLGDALGVTVNLYGDRIDLDLKIVGVFDLFPTWEPSDGPLIVGNLDYLYERAGMEFPYDVWVETEPNADYERIIADLEELGIIILNFRVAEDRLNEEQIQPERQGLFGVLSIGFIALAFMTVLGFFLYALFSFRSRYVELGMLRALGLSAKQLVLYLSTELILLLLIGLGTGTGLGVWVSNQFIPILQMGSGPEAKIPPFIIQIDWFSVFSVYILMAILFLLALSTLSVLLLRMKIFEAIKMGETG